MALTASGVQAELQSFFQDIASQIGGQPLSGVPFAGTIDTAAGSGAFANLEALIDAAAPADLRAQFLSRLHRLVDDNAPPAPAEIFGRGSLHCRSLHYGTQV